jgi:surfactin synthase thioesterase subunit
MSGYLALEPGPAGRLRLFCFHHAGAGALSYARWQRRFGDAVRVVPIRLPGRETRLREPRIVHAGRLLDELSSVLGPLCEEPHAFYGHSLGALVAYSFAAARAADGLRPPELLGVGASSAPHLGVPTLDDQGSPDRDAHTLLELGGGTPQELTARPQWQQTMHAILRDDLRLARSLRACSGAVLNTPLLAFAALEDRIAPVADVGEWARYTTRPFRLRTVPGGHFFVRGPVLPDLLAAELGEHSSLSPLH